MGKIAFILVVMVIASSIEVVAAEKIIEKQDRDFIPELPRVDNTPHQLKGTEKEEEIIPNKEEERAASLSAFSRFKALFRSNPNKVKEMNFKRSDASEALGKLKGVVGFRKTPTKLTPTKLKDLETYVRSNPEKWDAMTYYLEHYFLIELMIFLAGGAIFLGWRHLSG